MKDYYKCEMAVRRRVLGNRDGQMIQVEPDPREPDMVRLWHSDGAAISLSPKAAISVADYLKACAAEIMAAEA